MEYIKLNSILNRETVINDIKNMLKDFEKNKNSITIKRGFYIYGNPGSGKSCLINNILKELNYDIINYNASDVRNKSIIETITKHNMSENNVMTMFNKTSKKICIIMDEIDGMNNGDKGGINSLIKIIRPKKTKKQKVEEYSYNPIICIGNYHIDKKIKELMKVCNTFEIKTPTNSQIQEIIHKIMPTVDDDMKNTICSYSQNDLRKISSLYNIYIKKPNFFRETNIFKTLQTKSYIDDIKNTIITLFNTHYSLKSHNEIISETDRTIIALLWHENIVDIISKKKKNNNIPLYNAFLDNICFADYIDRITFQKQIWQFNEMTSLLKTFNNNYLLHKHIDNIKYNPKDDDGVRFTKVLTKYSTEFNNSVFIFNLTQQLMMDKNDLLSFFSNINNNNLTDNEINNLFENYDIAKLDINRITRYINFFNLSIDTSDENVFDDDYDD
uniref:AAA+ ATPase domain-containing protein n=1 Tax=viral metagenome TaxID=1070528 RepID=A0A6C0BSL2_9ZZZZ